jgi:hypothetical protein
MKRTCLLAALCTLVLAAGCATKKGFEQPGFAYGCPIGSLALETGAPELAAEWLSVQPRPRPESSAHFSLRRRKGCRRG